MGGGHFCHMDEGGTDFALYFGAQDEGARVVLGLIV